MPWLPAKSGSRSMLGTEKIEGLLKARKMSQVSFPILLDPEGPLVRGCLGFFAKSDGQTLGKGPRAIAFDHFFFAWILHAISGVSRIQKT